ncbi:MAG: DMT family transporter [Elusimicrobia bacterium]|nr:DMT family transporter [Elusimicrobiota bacterium]
MTSAKFFPILWALAAAAAFGFAAPAGKILLGALPPFQLAGLLYLGAALGTGPWAFDSASHRLTRRNTARLCAAIGFGGVIAPVLLLYGLKSASAASVSLWLPLELVATAALGVLFFHDSLGRGGWIAVGGAAAAAAILAWGEKAAGLRAGGLVAAACLCWGLDNQLTALVDGLSAPRFAFWKGLVAGAVNLGVGLALAPWTASARDAAAALALGAISYGASLVLYITAARKLGAARSQIVFSSAPFFGLLFSVLVLGESVAATQYAAAIVLAASLAMLLRERHEHAHTHEALAHEHHHRHDDGHHEHAHAGPVPAAGHSHRHEHEPIEHVHAHWPDLHHRHEH